MLSTARFHGWWIEVESERRSSRLRLASQGAVEITNALGNSMNDDAITRAIAIAVSARELSHAPYSRFPMGSGVVGTDGRETRGALVENVSLGLAMCSERVALFTAVVEGITPQVLALCSARTGDDLTFPCGACLQVALEIAGPDLTIVAVDLEGSREIVPLAELLPQGPYRFSPTMD